MSDCRALNHIRPDLWPLNDRLTNSCQLSAAFCIHFDVNQLELRNHAEDADWWQSALATPGTPRR